jgi:hypothetical protein
VRGDVRCADINSLKSLRSRWPTPAIASDVFAFIGCFLCSLRRVSTCRMGLLAGRETQPWPLPSPLAPAACSRRFRRWA